MDIKKVPSAIISESDKNHLLINEHKKKSHEKLNQYYEEMRQKFIPPQTPKAVKLRTPLKRKVLTEEEKRQIEEIRNKFCKSE